MTNYISRKEAAERLGVMRNGIDSLRKRYPGCCKEIPTVSYAFNEDFINAIAAGNKTSDVAAIMGFMTPERAAKLEAIKKPTVAAGSGAKAEAKGNTPVKNKFGPARGNRKGDAASTKVTKE
jgi:hypothetical protein